MRVESKDSVSRSISACLGKGSLLRMYEGKLKVVSAEPNTRIQDQPWNLGSPSGDNHQQPMNVSAAPE